ncbi:MAG: serine/threonine protein kinase [Planctomycetes bacterium]|nr:serine/threonine protein kinase [Planctomycetota bacterium]
MTSFARHDRLQELFAAACALPVPDRERYLRERCAGDAGLFEEARALVSADARPNPLDQPALAAYADLLAASSPPHLERYELEAELGEGGMGVVYRARQREPVQRTVALKVLKPVLGGAFAEPLLRRFEDERQTLASLDHTGIATIFDAGVARDGRPFFAMELVDGAAITRFCDRERLDLRARLALLAEVCDAVHHAHGRGIVHCDLKPSNVLVTHQDGRPLVKVIDFGIARAIDASSAGGTAGYVSPERSAGAAAGPGADVYSLGVVLKQLVAGGEPDRSVPGTAIAAMPAARARVVARRRRTSPVRLLRECRRDLDWIAGKALAPAAARYGSAADLASDLRRYLADRPVAARPRAPGYALGKLLIRQRSALAAALALVCAAVALANGFAWSARADSADEDLRAASVTLIDRARDYDLASAPGSDAARELLVADGLRISEGLLDRSPADPRLQDQVLRGRHTTAMLHMERGEWSDAERVLRLALADAETRGATPTRREMAELDLIRVLRHRRAFDEARQRAADVTARSTVKPQDPWVDRAAAIAAWQELAWLEHFRADGPAALAAARAALALTGEEPASERDWFLANRSETYKLLGTVIALYAADEDFERWFAASVADSRELIGDARATQRRHLLALTFDSWAVACVGRGGFAGALARARDGLELMNALVRDYPGRAQYAATWLMLEEKVAEALAALEGRSAAVRELEFALERGREFTARHPDCEPIARRIEVLTNRLAELERR